MIIRLVSINYTMDELTKINNNLDKTNCNQQAGRYPGGSKKQRIFTGNCRGALSEHEKILQSRTLPIPAVADFLMMLFNKGLSVSTLNGYRSAISSTVTCFDDISLGNHPVMIKLLKGFSNIRPSLYKEPKKWSIDAVLTICSWRDNTVLELNYLTWKLSMLMALASGSRCGDLD